MTTHLGDCRDEDLIEDIFGSVSEFACICEKYGDEGFMYCGVEVVYDDDTDIHTFYLHEEN